MFNLPGKTMFSLPQPMGRSRARRPSFSVQAQQFFSRVTDPGAARKALYAAAIDATVSAGVFSKLDGLYAAAADFPTMATNIISANYTCVEMNDNGTLTFTVDRGIVGNVPNVIDSTFAPTTAGGHFQRDSASAFVYVANNGVVSSQAATFASVDAVLSNVDSSLYTNYTGLGIVAQLNCSAGAVVASDDGTNGLYTLSREASSSLKLYKNGVLIGTDATPSTALTSGNTLKFCLQNQRMGALFGYGGALTSTEASALYNAWLPYLTAVGAV